MITFSGRNVGQTLRNVPNKLRFPVSVDIRSGLDTISNIKQRSLFKGIRTELALNVRDDEGRKKYPNGNVLMLGRRVRLSAYFVILHCRPTLRPFSGVFGAYSVAEGCREIRTGRPMIAAV